MDFLVLYAHAGAKAKTVQPETSRREEGHMPPASAHPPSTNAQSPKERPMPTQDKQNAASQNREDAGAAGATPSRAAGEAASNSTGRPPHQVATPPWEAQRAAGVRTTATRYAS